MGYRVSQLRKPQNRHLVDVRSADSVPPHQRKGDVLVLTPAELISIKMLSMVLEEHAGADKREACGDVNDRA